MTFIRRRKTTPTIQMTPMVDVIFFLLTFFILFTTFKTQRPALVLNCQDPLQRRVTTQPISSWWSTRPAAYFTKANWFLGLC